MLPNLGYVEKRIGDFDRAEAYITEALRLDLETQDSDNVAQDLVGPEGVASTRGEGENSGAGEGSTAHGFAGR